MRAGRVRKAFSLLEIVLALAISSFLLAMAVVNLWPARTAANSHSLADSLAEELRLARSSAIASGVPVGVGLATAGAGPHAQAIYTLSGAQLPKLQRVRSFAQEFSGSYLCIGTWGVNAGVWSHTQPQPMSNSDSFNPASWNNPVNAMDPTLIFTPSGSVTSNGMPLWNGSFQIVASQGVLFQATSVSGSGPALNYHNLQRLAKPYTVSVTPAGHISVQPGLNGTDGTVSLDDRSFDTPAAPAAPTAVLAANAPPTITACQLTPQPPDGTPAGAAVLAPGQHLGLRVTATDAQGDRLYCRWTANDGVFSSAIEDRMEWDGSQWVSNWEWRPPTGAVSGNYALTCSVRDQRGASVSGGANGSLAVSLESNPSIVFGACTADSVLPKRSKVISLNGTGETVISKGGLQGEWMACADGQELIYLFGGGLLYACHKDGSGNRLLSLNLSTVEWFFTLGRSFYGRPAISPGGTQAVCAGIGSAGSGGVDLFLCDLKGGTFTPLVATAAADEDFPFWSGDGRFIAFRSATTSATEILVKPAAGGPAFSLTGALPGNQEPVDLCPTLVNGHYRLLYSDGSAAAPLHILDFDSAGAVVNANVGSFSPFSTFGPQARLSPDGSKVAYSDGVQVFVANADGTGVVSPPAGGGVSNSPVFTPDSRQVVFWSNRDCPTDNFRGDLYRMRADGSSFKRVTRDNQVVTFVMFPFAGWDVIP